jgi:hypothetical protein
MSALVTVTNAHARRLGRNGSRVADLHVRPMHGLPLDGAYARAPVIRDSRANLDRPDLVTVEYGSQPLALLDSTEDLMTPAPSQAATTQRRSGTAGMSSRLDLVGASAYGPNRVFERVFEEGETDGHGQEDRDCVEQAETRHLTSPLGEAGLGCHASWEGPSMPPAPAPSPLGDSASPSTPIGLRLLPPVVRYRPPAGPPLWSADATWRDLATQHRVPGMTAPGRGWMSRWTVTYRHASTEITESVAAVSPGDLLSSDPIRTNTWHARTMTRSGLHFVASTGELQAHESLFERDLLVVLDFDAVTAVASQPFTLMWHDGQRRRRHTPDFMIVADGAPVVVNVRPAPLVNDALLENCAAIAEVCTARGWGHALVTDYPRPPFTVLSTISATRNCDDPYGYGEDILERLATDGPTRFARLTESFPAPAFARAILQRLIWDREVTVDLSRLLADNTLVALPGREPTR